MSDTLPHETLPNPLSTDTVDTVDIVDDFSTFAVATTGTTGTTATATATTATATGTGTGAFAVDEFDLEDEFDPLEDTEPDPEDEDYEESVELIGAPELAARRTASTEATDTRPAAERIADLFDSMAPRRKVLLGILSFCQTPQLVTDVSAEVDRLQENNFSVYSAANLCMLLEKAGALRRVTQDGEEFSRAKVEPRVVEIDGVEYLEPGTAPEAYWLDTAEGREALEADKPLERLTELFATDARYLPIYKRVLTLCAQEGGQTAKALGDAIDSDPLVQNPRLYAPRFVNRLEKCDALVWAKSWITSDIGRNGLALLDNVTDDYLSPTQEQPPPAGADTNGEVS
jgi:hypothetical protein